MLRVWKRSEMILPSTFLHAEITAARLAAFVGPAMKDDNLSFIGDRPR